MYAAGAMLAKATHLAYRTRWITLMRRAQIHPLVTRYPVKKTDTQQKRVGAYHTEKYRGNGRDGHANHKDFTCHNVEISAFFCHCGQPADNERQ